MFTSSEISEICINDFRTLWKSKIFKNIKNSQYYQLASVTDGFFRECLMSVGVNYFGKFIPYSKCDSNHLNNGTPIYTKQINDLNQPDKIRFKLISNLTNLRPGSFGEEYLKFFNLYIKDSNISGKLFGLKDKKAEYIGRSFDYRKYSLNVGLSKKLDSEIYYIEIYDVELKKNIKFSIADVDFKLINFESYNLPKDKTIYPGDTVIIKSDDAKIKWQVIDINPDKTSKKISRRCNNRYKDVIIISNGEIIKNVYAKYLKKI